MLRGSMLHEPKESRSFCPQADATAGSAELCFRHVLAALTTAQGECPSWRSQGLRNRSAGSGSGSRAGCQGQHLSMESLHNGDELVHGHRHPQGRDGLDWDPLIRPVAVVAAGCAARYRRC